MAIKKLDQKYINSIRKEFNRKLNFQAKYTVCVQCAAKTAMSAGATASSLYGLFPPHADVNVLTDVSRLGKVVSDGKNVDFKYYFDKDGNVILIERFDPTSQYVDKLVGTVFVEYAKNREITALVCKGKTENISTVAKCKLDLYGRLIRYVECTCGVNGYPYVYTIMRLQHFGKTINVRHSVYSVWQEGDEMMTSEKRYDYKNGILRQKT